MTPAAPTTHTVVRTGPAGQETRVPTILPLLPIRNLVVFPGTVMPLNVGRARSKAVVDEVMPGDKVIGVIAQRDPEAEDPTAAQLYDVGVICAIVKLLKLNDGNQSIIVHGLARFRVKRIVSEQPFPAAEIEVLDDTNADGPSIEALINSTTPSRQRCSRLVSGGLYCSGVGSCTS